LYFIHEGGVFSLLTILILKDFWIYVYFSNCSDKSFYVEVSVNKPLGFAPTLDILYIEPYNGYVEFWRYFNDF